MKIGDKVKMPDVVTEAMSEESGISMEKLTLLGGKTLTVSEITIDSVDGSLCVDVKESIFSIPVKWLAAQPAEQ